MTNKIKSLILAVAFVSALSTAAPKSNVSTTTTESVPQHFGLGFSSFGSGAGAAGPAFSGLLEIGALQSLQMLAALNDSDPFEFSLGAAYRYNVFGNNNLGWHVGFGFNLGTVGTTSAIGTTSTSFYLNLIPLTGFQFALGGALSNIKLGFDGGFLMHVTPSPFTVTLNTLSALLGLHIHYFF